MTDVLDSFDASQLAVYTCIRDTNESVLLTGVAGCGKSTIIRRWLQHLAENRLDGSLMVLAPTGVAALAINGSTIHRAFGFFPNMDSDNPRISLKTKTTLYYVQTIVIDEVSMVRADLLAAMDTVLRSVKRVDAPFGGVRLILVGDFYQLPPVVREEEERWLEQKHGSRAGWAFFAPCFQKLQPKVFYLGKSFRQAGDTRYTDILNAVRVMDASVVQRINVVSMRGSNAGEDVPKLCARRNDVSMHNNRGLARLGQQTYQIDPVIEGDADKVPKEARTPIVLALGARVMILRNGSGYVNGSLGVLTNFECVAVVWASVGGQWVQREVGAFEVRLDHGNVVAVPRMTQEVLGYETDQDGVLEKTVLASVSQYPLALAYGWTIHKSQGQTLEKACIDLGRGSFAHGQTYVALSRLTSSAGLYLSQPLTRSDLLLDPDVVHFFGKYVV